MELNCLSAVDLGACVCERERMFFFCEKGGESSLPFQSELLCRCSFASEMCVNPAKKPLNYIYTFLRRAPLQTTVFRKQINAGCVYFRLFMCVFLLFPRSEGTDVTD